MLVLGIAMGALLPEVSASDVSRAVFQRLDTTDGLSGKSVAVVLQDREGQIWFGTSSGLDHFDGRTIRALRHDGNGDPARDLNGISVTALCEDDSGALWIGTRAGGLRRLDATRKKLQRIDGLASTAAGTEADAGTRRRFDEIDCVATDADGAVWVGTRGGLLRFEVRTAGQAESPQARVEIDGVWVRTLFRDADENFWIGTDDGDLYRLQRGEKEPTLIDSFSTAVTALATHHDGGLWVGTSGGGVQHFARKGGGDGWLREPLPSFGHVDGGALSTGEVVPMPREITALSTDWRGDLWAGTLRGVFHWRRADSRVELIERDANDASSLAGNRVKTVFVDRGRVLWLGLDQAGVSRFDLRGEWFERFRSGSGGGLTLSHNSVRAFAPAPRGQLWIGTERGLNLWDPRRGRCDSFFAEETTGLDEDFINALLSDSRGRLWVGIRGGGLACYQDGKFHSYRKSDGGRIGLTSDSVSALLEHSSDGRLWVGTEGGGLLYRNEKEDRFVVAAGAASSYLAFVSALAEADEGRVWVGSLNGLFQVDAESGAARSVRGIWPGRKGVENFSVRCLLSDKAKKRLWIGSERMGLFLLDTATGEWRVFTRKNADLPADSIAALALDPQGRLWVSAGSGLATVEADDDIFTAGSAYLESVDTRRFSARDGLQDGAFLAGAAYAASDRMLYFGGDGGFNRVDPDGLPPLPSPPTPVLTTLELLGAPVSPGRDSVLQEPLPLTSEVKIPATARKRFSIRFSALDYAASEQPRFRYRLIGLDQDWSLAAGERRATYTALEPGDYRFEVQSSLDGRRWSEGHMAGLDIEVRAAWHETWWARGGSAILGTLLLFGGGLLLLRGREALMRRRRERLEMKCSRAEAALARQLQGALLVQRTGREIRIDSDGDHGAVARTFGGTLEELGKHFAVDRCQAFRCAGDDKSEDTKTRESGGGEAIVMEEWTADGVGAARSLRVPIAEDSELIRSARLFHSAVGSDDVASDQSLGEWRRALSAHGVVSLLVVRTRFLGRTNGFLLLHQCGKPRRWKNDEKLLLETVADQFGMAIAQLDLSVKEERNRCVIEAAREAAEVANKAKSDFLAKMTHELRTPLNAIIGFSEMIKTEGGLAPTVESHIDVINSSGEHLLSVINEVLEMSRIESGKADLRDERFAPEQLIRSATDMLSLTAKSKGLDLQLDLRSDLPAEIRSDKGKLRQIMINLLGNAIKFTREGWIRLSVHIEELDRESESETKADDDAAAAEGEDLAEALPRLRLWFEIRDTGAGIAEDELPTVFEKFAQTESGRGAKEGSGLGLAIAHHFVGMMGGKLTVQSKVDVGTAFTFYIEADDTSELAARDAANGGSGHAGAGASDLPVEGLEVGHEEVRILIAEDQPVNRLLLTKILGKAGFALCEAENGIEAVEKWQEWNPHLILMDEEMPGMRGTEAAQRITELAGDERPAMVSLTAFALDEQRHNAMEAGCVDFLSKPFKAAELFDIIQRHVPVRYRYVEPKKADDSAGRSAA